MLFRHLLTLVALSLPTAAFAAPLPCAADAPSPREGALACLDDRDHRSEALQLLAWTGTTADVDRIAEHVAENPNALRALAGIGGPAAVRVVLDTASDPRAPYRGAAIEALGTVGGDDALAVLVRLVRDPDHARSAADGLARLGTPAALEAVSAAFDAAMDSRSAWFYADALRAFPADGEASDVLWRTVEEQRWPAAPEALHALAMNHDPRVRKVVEKWLTVPDEDVRDVAIDALAELPAAEALPVLRAHLARGDADDAQAVAQAMLELDPSTRAELVSLVEEGPEAVAVAVAEAVWPYIGAHEVEEARALIEKRPGPVAARLRYNMFVQSWHAGAVPEGILAEARRELERNPDDADSWGLELLVLGGAADRQRLIDRANDGTTAWRILAIEALAIEPGKAMDDRLLAWVADPNREVATAAVAAFDDRSPAAQARLTEQLLDSPLQPSPWCGCGLWDGPLTVRSEGGEAYLVDQITTGTGIERDAAIEALLETERPAELDRLLALAPTLDADGRQRVHQAVLDSERAPLELVVRLLDAPHDDVVVEAIEALVIADPDDAEDRLAAIAKSRKRDDTVREAAIEGLAVLAPSDIEARLQRYAAKAPLSGTALTQLAQRGTSTALAHVLDVARNDKDPEIRVAAVEAFWGVEDERVTALYVDLLDDPADDVRAAALSALGRVGTTRVAEVMEPRLASDDPVRAAEAAGVLLDLDGAPAERNDRRIRELAEDEPSLQWQLD